MAARIFINGVEIGEVKELYYNPMDQLSHLPNSFLSDWLRSAIEEERFEDASKIRDEIKLRNDRG